MRPAPPISVQQWTRALSRWDVLAVLLVLGILIFFAEASRNLLQPMPELRMTPLSLEPTHLPEYAARTTLRMLLALSLSLVFTFTYATLAAKSRRAEVLLIPLLDILQSVPILGFISATAVFFMSLAPGRVLGSRSTATPLRTPAYVAGLPMTSGFQGWKNTARVRGNRTDSSLSIAYVRFIRST